jgi:hypothetical protein
MFIGGLRVTFFLDDLVGFSFFADPRKNRVIPHCSVFFVGGLMRVAHHPRLAAFLCQVGLGENQALGPVSVDLDILVLVVRRLEVGSCMGFPT